MKRIVGLSSALAIATCMLATNAWGVQHPSYLPMDGLSFYDGRTARNVRLTTNRPGKATTAAWKAFQANTPGDWMAMWDEVTGVPVRIWGSGIAAPGTSGSAKKAERMAKIQLKAHLGLLAPGASINDFELVSNLVDDVGQRVVAFKQSHRGLPVQGGQLSFRFRNDRMFMISSQALPYVSAGPAPKFIDADLFAKTAVSWLQQEGATSTEVTHVGEPMVMPLIGPNQVYGYHTVVPVTVNTKPLARFDVFVDVVTGKPVAREQTLRFATGTVQFNVPERYPQGNRADFPAPYVSTVINNNNSDTNSNGVVTFNPDAPTNVSVAADGQYAGVNNQAGPEISTQLPLSPNGTAVWNEANSEYADAQLTSYIHTNIAKEHARSMSDLSWVEQKLPVNVNINDTCNAFWDGNSINFFRESNQCNNTARLSDVVYHEFGHGFHQNAIIPGSGSYDGALGEGVADFFSASYTNDPAMGRGFFNSAAPLRHIDPDNDEAVWPQDIQGGNIHGTGLIIGGTLWDLRKLLVAKLGQDVGAAHTDVLFYSAIRHANDIPTMYPEVLAADDDDGDLSNGTPNVCEIISAFGLHGLRSIDAEAGSIDIATPEQEDYEVSLKVSGLYPECPEDSISSVMLGWRLRNTPAQVNQIAMDGGPIDYTAVIPQQDPGQVVQFDVRVALNNGPQLAFPDNPADPLYEFFVGDVIPLYCTDFETDPAIDGWTHGLLEGEPSEGADDWQWGAPGGSSDGADPTAAFSGVFAYGNDLALEDNFNGLYQADKVNYSDSPVVDTEGYENIRLQYRRWLNVEDGFYDRARIYSNGTELWNNRASSQMDGANVHHTDKEWRFHDVDLSETVGEDNTVQIRFELDTDGGLQMGGWTMDDFCIVAYQAPPPVVTECGNGEVEVGEQCDDGNTENGDGCDSNCQLEDEDPPVEEPPTETPPFVVDSGCGCRTASSAPSPHSAWLLLGLVGLGALRRRRRRG